MTRILLSVLLPVLFAMTVAAPVAAQSRTIDIESADGAMIKATYASPGRPGPGMLLVHQCNMDRRSWSAMADALVEGGVHVVTIDLRGFGESPGEPVKSREGFQTLMAKSPADLDAAYAFLVRQPGVDAARIGVGGASCGATLTADLAARRPSITALMLLSGPPSDAAIAHIASTPGLAVFGAAADKDTITPDVAAVIHKAVSGSKHPRSIARILQGTEHGLPMFERDPALSGQLVTWLIERLGTR